MSRSKQAQGSLHRSESTKTLAWLPLHFWMSRTSSPTLFEIISTQQTLEHLHPQTGRAWELKVCVKESLRCWTHAVLNTKRKLYISLRTDTSDCRTGEWTSKHAFCFPQIQMRPLLTPQVADALQIIPGCFLICIFIFIIWSFVSASFAECKRSNVMYFPHGESLSLANPRGTHWCVVRSLAGRTTIPDVQRNPICITKCANLNYDTLSHWQIARIKFNQRNGFQHSPHRRICLVVSSQRYQHN